MDEKLLCENARDIFSPIELASFYCLSFSGESSTICSLAGQLIGAFYGQKASPIYLFEMCEDHDKVQENARQLFKMTSTQVNVPIPVTTFSF